MEDKILQKYFIEKMKQIDIANELNISKYKVSRVVTKDIRYVDEKNRRKIENKKKHIEKTKEYIYKQRKLKHDLSRVKRDHVQAVTELSDRNRPMNNRVFRDWNSSVYKYNSENKSYVLKENIITGIDVPNKINWR